MAILVLGLVLFLGAHSVRIVADGWRGQTIARIGERRWKGLYSLVAILGFVLLVWGYALARRQGTPVLWTPPFGMNHLAALLMLPAFVLLVATYVPRNAIRARLRHPMLLSVKLWALAHLLANGSLADVVLFGAFLVWAVLAFRAARARDRAGQGSAIAASSMDGTAIAVIVGLIAWALFAFRAHAWLIGVSPLGR